MGTFVALFVVLLFIAAFSAAETSFVSADRVSLIVQQKRFQFNSAFFFLKDSGAFFATVVIGSNLFITMFSSMADFIFHEQLQLSMSVVLPLTTFLGFLLGELVPKSVALDNPEIAARYFLPIVKLFYEVTKPVVKFTESASRLMAKVIFNYTHQPVFFERRDVYRFLGNTVSGGYLDKIESEIIRNLLGSARLPVKKFAVPRTQIVAVKAGTEIDKLREVFERTGKTKVVVFNSSLDDIVGVVHAKDIFTDVEKVDELIREVLFVPESITIIDLLEEFRNEKIYVAILIDEFGGTTGLITSSDIMEVFLGDVVPFAEGSGGKLKRLNNKQFIVHGSTEISELEKSLKLKLLSKVSSDIKSDFTTVAGLIISYLGRIPSEGERFYISGYEFQILKSDGRKVESVKLTLQ